MWLIDWAWYDEIVAEYEHDANEYNANLLLDLYDVSTADDVTLPITNNSYENDLMLIFS
jgi:hypothetical protein